MSRIKESIEQYLLSKEMGEEAEKKKKAVTIRLDEFHIFCIDLLAEKLESNRTQTCHALVSDGIFEGLEVFGITKIEELQAMFMAKRSGRKIEDVRADLGLTGVFTDEVKNV